LYEQEERVKKGWYPMNPKRAVRLNEENGKLHEGGKQL